jgi:hypothetical protein
MLFTGALAALGAFVFSASAQTIPDFTYHAGNALVLDGNVISYGNSADMNGDGIDELIVPTGSYPTRQSNSLAILEWDGAQFANRTAELIGPVPSSDAFTDVLTEDFDGDGRSDVFLGAFGYDDTPFPGAKNFLLLQKQTGKLTNASNQIDGGEDTTYFATAGDINNDRHPDIFVINLDTKFKDGPHFSVSRRNGTFKTKRKLINPDYAKPPDKQAALSSSAIADIDNDGPNDLIVGRENGVYVGVYFNKKGSFKRDKPDIKLPKLALGKGSSHPLDIKAIDFDLDGYTDIVVFCAGWPSFSPFSVQFFRNIKGRKFKDVTSSVLPGKPKSRPNLGGLDRLRLVDFHGDGLVDLVGYAERGPESSTLIFMNDGSGRFSEHNWQFFRATQGHGYRTVFAANLNGDDRTDLVTVSLISPGMQSTYQFEAFINDGVADAAATVSPTIARNLKKRTKVKKGEKLHLAALVRGDRPFTFQWMKNGQPIPGATGPSLEYPKAKKKNKGTYSVQITNAVGTVMSAETKVKVKKKKKKK